MSDRQLILYCVVIVCATVAVCMGKVSGESILAIAGGYVGGHMVGRKSAPAVEAGKDGAQ